MVVFSFIQSWVAQGSSEWTQQENPPCDACGTTPDGLTRYIMMMNSILKAINPDQNSVSLSGKVIQNAKTDITKEMSEEYFGTFRREWVLVGGQIIGRSYDAIKALTRDFVWDFGRQTVAWVKAQALTRDIDKLDELDESIDAKAIRLIGSLRYRDRINNDQSKLIINTVSAYPDIIKEWSFVIQSNATYRDMLGWMNHVQRSMKNHITFTPKKTTKLEWTNTITYILNPTWSDKLKNDYECVHMFNGSACNKTLDKTERLWDEFSKSVGKEFGVTINKFVGSSKKLRLLLSKQWRSTLFDWSENGVEFNGKRLFFDRSTWNSNVLIQDLRQEKDSLLKTYTVWQQSEQALLNWSEADLGDWNSSSIWPEKIYKNTTTKWINTSYQVSSLTNSTIAESTKVQTLLQSMNQWVDHVVSFDDEQEVLISIVSPLSVTRMQPLLSEAVYNTKLSLSHLIGDSIDACLAFCPNLNSKVNCGSK